MPNGGDRNFIRLCSSLEGFRLRHGAWPTEVRLFPGAIADLREHVLGPEAFSKLEALVRLIADEEASMIAQDKDGNSFNYGEEQRPDGTLDISAAEWLGVRPLPGCYDDIY